MCKLLKKILHVIQYICRIFLAQFVFYCAFDRLMMVNAGIGALFPTMPLHISEWFNQLVEPQLIGSVDHLREKKVLGNETHCSLSGYKSIREAWLYYSLLSKDLAYALQSPNSRLLYDQPACLMLFLALCIAVCVAD